MDIFALPIVAFCGLGKLAIKVRLITTPIIWGEQLMIRGWIGLIVASVLFALPTSAQQIDNSQLRDTKGQKSSFTAWNGSYRRSIALEVPLFRGIEPKLSLSYDSAKGIRNIPSAGGLLGIGWSIDGLSVIERISGADAPAAGTDKKASGRGVPAYGATGFPLDSFSVDGEELVPCTQLIAPSNAPSCAVPVTAGQIAYASRVENFERFRQDPVSNTWTITTRVGVSYLYKTLEGGAADSTFRWYLASVIDRRGNHVDYGWLRDGNLPLNESVLASIGYYNNGSATRVSDIAFGYDLRPDPVTFATGREVRNVVKRVRSITVNSAGQHLRAYGLTYEQSPSTGASRLTQVQEFGRDFVYSAATSTITSGTSLPAYKFTYSDLGGGSAGPVFGDQAWAVSSGTSAGDFNGDGLKLDYMTVTTGVSAFGFYSGPPGASPAVYPSTTSASFGYSTGGPSNSNVAGSITSTSCNTASGIPVADYVGDGKDEFSCSGSYTVSQNLVSWYGQKYCDNVGLAACTLISTQSSGDHIYAVNGTTATEIFAGTNFNGTIGFSADINGDGKADLVMTAANSVFISNGSAFVAQTWAHPAIPIGDINHRLQPGDFNGDGKIDLLDQWFSGGYWNAQIWLSTGTNFVAQPVQSIYWPGPNFDNTVWSLADANGDGMTDIVNVWVVNPNAVNTRSLLSTGRSFDLSGAAMTPVGLGGLTNIVASGFSGAHPTFGISDFDGDGLADIYIARNSNGTTDGIQVDRDIIRGVQRGTPYLPFVTSALTTVQDFNGDGLADFQRGATIAMNGGPVPDLLTSFAIPLGGKEAITYRSSAGLPSTRLPFIMQLVSSVTTDDGRGNSTTTDFAYAGGQWSQSERQFMGFRTIMATLPANGGETARPQVTTTYQQSLACLGRAALVEHKDGIGVVLKTEKTGFQINTSVPMSCLESSHESWDRVAGTAAVKKSRVEHSYDLYGNETQTIDYGNLDVAADDVSVLRYFYPNTSDYLVSCPAVVYTYWGVGTATPIVGQALYYDNNSYTVPPLRCEQTYEGRMVNSTSWIPSFTKTYDAFGNLRSVTDALNNRTETIYDTATSLLPVETRLPKYFDVVPDMGFKTATNWDPVCQKPLSETDVNGQITAATYDPLCRQTRVDKPGGDYVITQYINFGQPNNSQQITKLTPPAGGQSLQRYHVEYLDGFGRTWNTADRHTTSDNINVWINFNARGEVASVTTPFPNSATSVVYTTYAYDALDRLIKTTNPDGSIATLTYALAPATSDTMQITATDEIGHQIVYTMDTHDKLVKRTKMKGGTPLVTEYRRDPLGRVVNIIDPLFTSWSYAYDGLSRRISVADPDLGNWSYVYDAASRVTSQTDAKGQVTLLTYDVMGRVLNKAVSGAAIATETTSNIYDEPRASFFNRGKLTSATRSVPANGTLAAVNVVRQSNFDLAGRLVQETHLSINGQDRREVPSAPAKIRGKVKTRYYLRIHREFEIPYRGASSCVTKFRSGGLTSVGIWASEGGPEAFAIGCRRHQPL